MTSSVTRHLPFAQVDIEDIPPEVVDELPDNVIDQLTDGVIDQIPTEVFDSLPSAVQDQIPDGLVEAASSNPTFAVVLLAIGVIAAIMFVLGVLKSAVKWMLYSAVIGVGAWYLFFQQ